MVLNTILPPLTFTVLMTMLGFFTVGGSVVSWIVAAWLLSVPTTLLWAMYQRHWVVQRR